MLLLFVRFGEIAFVVTATVNAVTANADVTAASAPVTPATTRQLASSKVVRFADTTPVW